jgi:hypothetical protein
MLMARHRRGWRRCFDGGVARERRPSDIAGPPGAGDRHSRCRSRVHAAGGGSPPIERKSGEGHDRRRRELEQPSWTFTWDRGSVVAKRDRTGSRRDSRRRQQNDVAGHEPEPGGRRSRSPYQGSHAGPHASANSHADTDAQTCRDAFRGPDAGTYPSPDAGTYPSPDAGTYPSPDADCRADADADAHTQTHQAAQTYRDTNRNTGRNTNPDCRADRRADADCRADADADCRADADAHTQTQTVAQAQMTPARSSWCI